jgi:uncharacterized protein (DUF305 family)
MMSTKLDQEFVKATRKHHQDAVSGAQNARLGFETLVAEVERLEGVIERIAKTLDPHYSPGGDVEWLAQNYVTNVNAMMAKK